MCSKGHFATGKVRSAWPQAVPRLWGAPCWVHDLLDPFLPRDKSKDHLLDFPSETSTLTLPDEDNELWWHGTLLLSTQNSLPWPQVILVEDHTVHALLWKPVLDNVSDFFRNVVVVIFHSLGCPFRWLHSTKGSWTLPEICDKGTVTM